MIQANSAIYLRSIACRNFPGLTIFFRIRYLRSLAEIAGFPVQKKTQDKTVRRTSF